MKKVFLFRTNPLYYLIEIPPILLLIIAIMHNSEVKTLFKLYPLIIASALLIIFIAVYFFRGLLISSSEVRCIGYFSSRDEATVEKNKALVLTVGARGILTLEIFTDGQEGYDMYTWMKSDDPHEINVFRAKARGGNSAVKRILKIFDIETEDIETALLEEQYEKDCGNLILKVRKTEKGKSVRLEIKETI